MKKILIVQRRMTHYRVPFFLCLEQKLKSVNVELTVAYGSGTVNEQKKNDSAVLPGGKHLGTRYLGNGRVCFQPLGSQVRDISLLIVGFENKLVCNLWHQYVRTPYKVALWGHGANLQSATYSLRERFKRLVALRADWWFTYTALSTKIVIDAGYARDRITTINNSLDTSYIMNGSLSVESRDFKYLKSLGLRGANTCIFVGSLYLEKQLDFLIAAADLIRIAVPDFELIIAGDGPLRTFIEISARRRPWLHYVGAVREHRKACLLSVSKLYLNPGLVGLGIIDSFAAQVPLITTTFRHHSPEISYLENWRNGVITTYDPQKYASAVTQILNTPVMLDELQIGCRDSASDYSLNMMVNRFSDGIQRCLDSDGIR